jgi:hypothetical protein
MDCNVSAHTDPGESVSLTLETFLWFLIYVSIPVLIIATCFRRIPPQQASLHLIPVSGSHSDVSTEVSEQDADEVQQRTRSLSTIALPITVKDRPKRFSLEVTKLPNSEKSSSIGRTPEKYSGNIV